MNILTKSLTALTLLTGAMMPLSPTQASPGISEAPAQSAMTTLLNAPATPLPKGTKLLSLRVAAGLATVNFSRELVDNFAGGDSAETRAVNSILRTLGQFPTVSRVQIQVVGQPIDSLGGLLALSDPLPVIRPTAQTVTAPGMHLHRKAAARHH